MINVEKNIEDGKYESKIVYSDDKHEEFRRDLYRLMKVFRKDLEKEFRVTKIKSKKRKLLFDTAWEFGHAYGYIDVYAYYSQLVDLIKV